MIATVNKLALEASIHRDSFFDFFCRFWADIVPEPLVLNWHIEYLCGELQALAERVMRREPKKYDIVINIPPGTTKSTICSVMFPVWCWIKDPTLRIITGSYSSDLSNYLASQRLRLITGDHYMEVFPEVVLATEGKELLVTQKGGQIIATSTGGSVTGMHAHIIIVDDPLNPKQAVSKVQVKTANDWFDHTLSTRKIDKAVTPLILIMQRLHQNDPTGHILEQYDKDFIRHICLPASVGKNVSPRSLRRKYVDGLLDPIRLNQKILDESRKQLGEYGYAGQMDQKPVPQGGAMFKTDQFKIVPSAAGIIKSVRYWDKAGTISKGAKYTVGCKLGVTKDGHYIVMDVVRGKWEAAERERIVKQTAILDGRVTVVGVEQEPGSGGKESAQNTLRMLAGWRVRLDRPVGDKELRADPYSVQVNNGNVSVVKAVWTREYIEEMQFFPFGTYKDQVDASSGAFALLSKIPRSVGALV